MLAFLGMGPMELLIILVIGGIPILLVVGGGLLFLFLRKK